jgi:putative CocE/NonD family hydrolase
MRIDIPGLWFMTWYDNSVAPNLAAYNFVRKTASPDVANEQYAIIAPVPHCAYKKAEEHTIVGERDLGDGRFDYDDFIYAWFDRFLKGEQSDRLAKAPKILYYTMGNNRWQSADTWPPKGAAPITYYLSSNGRANSLYGDGALRSSPLPSDRADSFTYDPMNPVPTPGGGYLGADHKAGAFDERPVETRDDVLVYSTGPLKEGIEVTGPVDLTLYVSSDAKDTDFTAKLVDVMPDGTAYNIEDNIQRMRYRDGYDKPPVWMENGQIYRVSFQPMQTSNYFAPGHQLRIEISSSNFPLFDRNLNTGGENFNELRGRVANNTIHHSAQYPSSVTLSVIKR